MDGQQPPRSAFCWSCAAGIEAGDKYCRSCGAGQGPHLPWYYTHAGIVLLSLLGLGPFGLILVWRSPLLGPRARWAYTAGLLLFTLYVLIQVRRAVLALQDALGLILQGISF